jgi:hypothetical protein
MVCAATCDWLLQVAASSDCQKRFPVFGRYGDDPFDYHAEDEFMTDVQGHTPTKFRLGSKCALSCLRGQVTTPFRCVARISVFKGINVSPNLHDEGPVASVTSSVTGCFLLILWADCTLMQIQKLVCC